MALETVRTKLITTRTSNSLFKELLDLTPPTTNPQPLQLDLRAQALEPTEAEDVVTLYNKEFGPPPDDQTMDSEAIPLENRPELTSTTPHFS
jgi:hypothetical protein